jgi:uncharacterized membrane protein
MNKNITRNLPELVAANVISEETAANIKAYYDGKEDRAPDKLMIIFSIFGAILIALGIILIVAHNWDDLSREIKTGFSFLPILMGQAMAIYVILKKYASVAWRESVAAFLFFAIGASISLVSQVYNIPGDISSFILTWVLLTLPLIYILRSSVVSLLYLTGITFYAVEGGYYTEKESIVYWILLFLMLPYYLGLYRKTPNSNFVLFHHWLVPLSVIICLGIVADKHDGFMYPAYMSLFGLLYLAGKSEHLNELRRYNNSYLLYGSAGSIIILLMLSFDWFWKKMSTKTLDGLFTSPEFLTTILITLGAVGLLLYNFKKSIKPEFPDFIFLLFILIFIAGLFMVSIPVIFINLLILLTGIMIIRKGARLDHLGILNYGLLIVTALVICRFFDTDLSFILRGVLFLAVGTGFFMMNYSLIKKRKSYGK